MYGVVSALLRCVCVCVWGRGAGSAGGGGGGAGALLLLHLLWVLLSLFIAWRHCLPDCCGRLKPFPKRPPFPWGGLWLCGSVALHRHCEWECELKCESGLQSWCVDVAPKGTVCGIRWPPTHLPSRHGDGIAQDVPVCFHRCYTGVGGGTAAAIATFPPCGQGVRRDETKYEWQCAPHEAVYRFLFEW